MAGAEPSGGIIKYYKVTRFWIVLLGLAACSGAFLNYQREENHAEFVWRARGKTALA
jgi:hypothetical protein